MNVRKYVVADFVAFSRLTRRHKCDERGLHPLEDHLGELFITFSQKEENLDGT